MRQRKKKKEKKQKKKKKKKKKKEKRNKEKRGKKNETPTTLTSLFKLVEEDRRKERKSHDGSLVVHERKPSQKTGSSGLIIFQEFSKIANVRYSETSRRSREGVSCGENVRLQGLG